MTVNYSNRSRDSRGSSRNRCQREAAEQRRRVSKRERTLFLERLEDRRLLAVSFSPAVSYPVSGQPYVVETGDFNEDGNLDLATGSELNGSPGIWLGNGDGSFQGIRPFSGLSRPLAVLVDDFNGDNHDDVAFANYIDGGGTGQVFLGAGDGTFSTGDSYRFGVGSWAISLASGDFNSDNKRDLAVGHYGPTDGSTLRVLLGNGNGTFQPPVSYSVHTTLSIVVQDVDGDHDEDILVAGSLNSNLSLLRGNGDGSFANAVDVLVGWYQSWVACGDLDRDGNQDVVTANSYNNRISVLLGNGDSTFQPAVAHATGARPESLSLADLNADGILDVAVSNYNSDNIGVLLGVGDGTLQPQATFATDDAPDKIAVGDFNHDHRGDIAVTNAVSCSISILLNDTSTITVVADAVPNDSHDFAYNGTLGTFSLDDDADATLPNVRSFGDRAPGTYVITEAGTAGWDLASLVIVDPDNGSSVDLTNRTATIDLDEGESVVVTFTNVKQGEIRGTKWKDLDGDGVRDGPILLVSPDREDAEIQRFDARTGVYLGAFTVGAPSGPQGLAFGPDGDLFVAGQHEHKIVRFDGTTGAFESVFVDDVTNMGDIKGIAFGPGGSLFVASYSDRILRYDGGTGAFLEVFAQGGGLSYPQAMVFAPDGDLFVSNYGNDKVLRYDSPTRAFLGEYSVSNPRQLAFGPDGALYVSSQGGNCIVRIDVSTGNATQFITAGSGGLNGPRGLAFSNDGDLYVASYYNNLILRYDGSTGDFLEEVASGAGLDLPGFVLLTPEEPGLANWTVYLDLDNDGTLDSGEPSTLTDANGEYSFTGLAFGDYVVREVQQADFRQTYPATAAQGSGRLSLVQALIHGGTDGTGNALDALDAPWGVTASSDGRFLYIAARDSAAVTAFRRDASTGALVLVQTVRNGDSQGHLHTVAGLAGAEAVAISPDQANLYVASATDSSIAVFSRDINTGALTFMERLADGGIDSLGTTVDGLASARYVVTSPDGLHVYAAAINDHSVATFTRNPLTGRLTFTQVLKDGGVDDEGSTVHGISHAYEVAISPDGQHVYATGRNGGLCVFARNSTTGRLRFVEVLQQGQTDSHGNTITGVQSLDGVAVSSDGMHVYTAAETSSAVAVFTRDLLTGRLAFDGALFDGQLDSAGNTVDGLHGARSVSVSPDGAHVYATSDKDHAVAVFRRERTTGLLSFVEVVRDGSADYQGNLVQTLQYAPALAISPDGLHVYTVAFEDNAVTAFRRDVGTSIFGTHLVRLSLPSDVIQTVDVVRSGDYNNSTTTPDHNGAPQEGIAVFGVSQSNPDVRYPWVFWPGIAGTPHLEVDDPAQRQQLLATPIPANEYLDTIDSLGNAHIQIAIGNGVDDACYLALTFHTSSGAVLTLDTPIPPQGSGPPLSELLFSRTVHVSVDSSSVTDMDFGNQRVTGEIRGTKWNDLDGDGQWEAGEQYLSGQTVYLDLNSDGDMDAGEPSRVTGVNGEYVFDGLQPGTYTVREALPAGWIQTAPALVWQATDGSVIQRFGPTGDLAAYIETNRATHDLELVGTEVWQATDGSVIQRFRSDGMLLGTFETNRRTDDLEVVGAEVWQATDGSVIQRFSITGDLLGTFETNRHTHDLEVVGSEVWQATDGSVIQRFSFQGSLLGTFETNRRTNDLEVVGTEIWQATDGSVIQRLTPEGTLLGTIETSRGTNDLEVVGAEVWQATDGSVVQRFDFNGHLIGTFDSNRRTNDLELAGQVYQVTLGAGQTIFGLDFGNRCVDHAPDANAGGPYNLNEGGTVQLDASGTTDPDQPSTALTYSWDLDSDGIFGETGEDATRGDEVGIFPTFSAAGLAGTSSIIVTLEVTDGAGLTSSDTATINVINADPIANPDGYTTPEDTTLAISAPGLLANDSDPGLDPVVVTGVNTAATVGTVVDWNPNGSFTYQPPANFNGLDGFDYTISDGQGGTATAHVTITVTPVADIAGRFLFYNNSAFDGNSAAANALDYDAIALAPSILGHGHSTGIDEPTKELGKEALLPGYTATFVNYSSYAKGLNGIIIAFDDLASPSLLTAADFEFRVGNSDTPPEWILAPAPLAESDQRGLRVDVDVVHANFDGQPDVVTIRWADEDPYTASRTPGAISNQWLQVTVLANSHTGLAANDVFFFGNQIGESGNSASDTNVDQNDEIGARNHPHTAFNPAPISDPYDFNRDRKVDQNDEILARDNPASAFTRILLLDTVALHDPLIIGGFDATRGGQTSLRDSDAMAPARAAITEAYPWATFTASGVITEAYLATIDVLVISSVFGSNSATTALSADEQAALLHFVQSGHGAVIVTDNSSFGGSGTDQVNESFLNPFGLDTTGNLTSTALTITNAAHPVTNGPFGTASSMVYGYAGWFDGLGPYAASLGRLSNGSPGLVAIDPNAMSAEAGGVVFASDSHFLYPVDIEASRKTLLLNSIAFAAGITPSSLVSPPGPAKLAAASDRWFTDPMLTTDEEFTVPPDSKSKAAVPDSPAYGKTDLVTGVMHEMGHVLGKPDMDSMADDLMADRLATGVRRGVSHKVQDAQDAVFADVDGWAQAIRPRALGSGRR